MMDGPIGRYAQHIPDTTELTTDVHVTKLLSNRLELLRKLSQIYALRKHLEINEQEINNQLGLLDCTINNHIYSEVETFELNELLTSFLKQ